MLLPYYVAQLTLRRQFLFPLFAKKSLRLNCSLSVATFRVTSLVYLMFHKYINTAQKLINPMYVNILLPNFNQQYVNIVRVSPIVWHKVASTNDFHLTTTFKIMSRQNI